MQKSTLKTSLLLSVLLGACTTSPKPVEEIAAKRSNPLEGMRFFVDHESSVSQELQKSSSDEKTKNALKLIAAEPAAIWLGAWTGAIGPAVAKLVAKADSEGTHLLVVPYNIPYRDCGQHSAGGLPAGAYRQWIDDLAAGIGQHQAVIVLEPDAIPLIDCLSSELKEERWQLLRYAVETLKTKSKAVVYLDVGHGNWVPANLMADRLEKIGVDRVDGFAINTSNYQFNVDNVVYARKLLARFPNKGFVVDTSRNGKGPSVDHAWCNPHGRAIGERPAVLAAAGEADAYLWIKRPGESDGACNGGPQAGAFWSEMAGELVRNATVQAN